MADHAKHTITRYSHGAGAWAEFDCGKCRVDMDFFDFDLQDLITLTEACVPKSCPNCGHVAQIEDRTPVPTMEGD